MRALALGSRGGTPRSGRDGSSAASRRRLGRRMRVRPRPWLDGLTPYRPGSHQADESGLLASNESPFGVDPAVVRSVMQAAEVIHRYPDPLASRLRDTIARRHRLSPEQVLVGNGSDELIYLLTWAFAANGGSVVCADPAYQLDVIAARVAGAVVRQVPTVEWRHDLDAMAHVEANLAYIVNPHNPTGTALSISQVADFAQRSRADIVVVDEAYVDFADVQSSIPLAASGKLLVLRTLSKLYGLAGARIGYLVGGTHVLDVLRAIRPPFSVNTLAQAAAQAALEGTEHYQAVREATIRNRGRLIAVLEQHGLKPVPSEANFVLVPHVEEGRFVSCAQDAGVAIRPGRPLGVPGCVRITVPDDIGLARIAQAVARYCSA
ncbi:MAG TPA: histidinol-phosphate transaminase [Actinomycetales bacterium]|nr:histidinol-phosphate transaminase [Actinomycetales bacterium]